MNSITREYKSKSLESDLMTLKSKSQQKALLKTLIAATALAAGIFAIIFIGSSLLPYGIAVILMSSLAIYEYQNQHARSSAIFTRATQAIAQTPRN